MFHGSHIVGLSAVAALVFTTGPAFATDDEPDSLFADGPQFAARAEGYIGGAIFELSGGGADDDGGVTGGGTGSAVGIYGPFHLQLDVFGDRTDPNSLSNVGVGGHAGLSHPEVGAIAMTMAYSRLDRELLATRPEGVDVFRVGGEVSAFLGPVTLGARGGVFDNDGPNTNDDFYVQGILRAYPIPNLALEGVGGYANASQNDKIATVRAGAEFRPEGMPVSVFARWEAGFINDLNKSNVDLQQHAVVVGVRVLFDGGLTLKRSDRVYFRDPCIGLLQYSARTC